MIRKLLHSYLQNLITIENLHDEIRQLESYNRISNDDDDTKLELLYKAKRVVDLSTDIRKYAQAKYSDFAVGSTILTQNDKYFSGVNIESSSYGLTICAERSALAQTLSSGDVDIVLIGVVADSVSPVFPCGACRQILFDYARDAVVMCFNTNGELRVTTVELLLPDAFTDLALRR